MAQVIDGGNSSRPASEMSLKPVRGPVVQRAMERRRIGFPIDVSAMDDVATLQRLLVTCKLVSRLDTYGNASDSLVDHKHKTFEVSELVAVITPLIAAFVWSPNEQVPYTWLVDMILWNKMVHAMNGNRVLTVDMIVCYPATEYSAPRFPQSGILDIDFFSRYDFFVLNFFDVSSVDDWIITYAFDVSVPRWDEYTKGMYMQDLLSRLQFMHYDLFTICYLHGHMLVGFPAMSLQTPYMRVPCPRTWQKFLHIMYGNGVVSLPEPIPLGALCRRPTTVQPLLGSRAHNRSCVVVHHVLVRARIH